MMLDSQAERIATVEREPAEATAVAGRAPTALVP
jgi:hypothetical protein